MRLSAALERIARAGQRRRPRGPAPEGGAQAAAVARIDALIADLRAVLGTEA